MWNTQNSETTSDSWSVGVRPLPEQKYFPVRVFSLHAEYSVSLAYQQQKAGSTSRSANNYNNINITDTNTSSNIRSWAFNNGNLLFGISVYF